MKKLFLFISIFLAAHLFSQNWAPINTTEKFCYTSDDDYEIIDNVLWVDTISQVGENQVYHLNKIARPIENLGFHYLFNEPQFLLDDVIIKPTGEWDFIDTSFNDMDTLSSFSLIPDAQINETWLFSEGVAAIVANITVEDILGETDSVKHIYLTDYSRILLSKNHGIINWRNTFYLVGIEGRDLGITVPNFDDMYANLSAGDVVCTYHNSWMTDGNFYRVIYKRRYDLLDVQRYEDSIVLNTYATIRREYQAPSGNSNTITTGNQTLVFKRNRYTEIYPNEVMYISLSEGLTWGFGYAISKLSRFKWGGLKKTQIQHDGEWGNSNLYYKCEGEYNFELCECLPENATVEMSEKFGFIEFSNFGFEWGGEQYIKGVIDGEDSLGYIYELIPPVGTNQLTNNSNWLVYPNPANNFITIQTPLETSQAIYKIYNINGLLLKEGVLAKKEYSITLNEFPAGMYFIELNINGKKSTKKWIKN